MVYFLPEKVYPKKKENGYMTTSVVDLEWNFWLRQWQRKKKKDNYEKCTGTKKGSVKLKQTFLRK
jgi:hypothetical protein